MKEQKADLNRNVFHTACRKKDLKIIKVLIEAAKDPSDPENGNGYNEWKEWLFGNANIYCQEILQDKTQSELNCFLQGMNNEVDFDVDEVDSKYMDTQINKDLEYTKFIFDLQSENGGINQNINVLSALDMKNNLELLLSNKKKDIDFYKFYLVAIQNCSIPFINKHELLQYKNVVNFRKLDPYKKSLLHIAVESKRKEVVTVILNKTDVKHLLIDMPDSSLKTPLHYAVRSNDVDMVKLILEHGANVDKPDINGKTPLKIATVLSKMNIVKLLLEYKAKIDTIDRSDGTTPLHSVISSNRIDLLKLLLQHKGACKTDVTDSYGKTPFQNAIKSGNGYILEVLLENGIGNESLADAWIYYYVKFPLHIASKIGPVQVVRALLQRKFDVNFMGTNDRTPLHEAAHAGNKEIVMELLKNGAQNHFEDRFGHTPLKLAKAAGHLEVKAIFTDSK